MTSPAAPEPSARPSKGEERFDLAGRLGKFERLAGGALRIPAYIARTGVQLYRDAAGTERREYRPAREVFDESSYRSFEGAPVTRLHPPELVTPDTWREHAIGTVQNVRPDGDRLAADLIISDGKAIAEIESGELVETSAGYTAVIDPTSGDAEGERYDAVQTHIDGNHVGLGPEGWGRAGPTVRLRVDARHQVITDPTAPAPERVERTDSMTTKRVRVDGIEYEAGTDSHLQAVEQHVGKLTAERDTAKRRVDELAAELETTKKERDDAKARADKASSPAEVDAALEARMQLVDQVRTVLGADYDWKNKDERELMTAVLEKAGVEIGAEDSPDMVMGAFRAVVASAAKSAPGSDTETDLETLEGEQGGGGEAPAAPAGGRGDGRFVVATFKERKSDGDPEPYMPPRMSEKWRR